MEKIRCVNINSGEVGFFVPSLANGKTQDSRSWQEATGWRPEPVPGDLAVNTGTPGMTAGSPENPLNTPSDMISDDAILGHREQGQGYDPMMRAGQVQNPPADVNLDLSQPDPNEVFPLEINNDLPLEQTEETQSAPEIPAAQTGPGTDKKKAAQGLKPKAATPANKKRTAGARKH